MTAPIALPGPTLEQGLTHLLRATLAVEALGRAVSKVGPLGVGPARVALAVAAS